MVSAEWSRATLNWAQPINYGNFLQLSMPPLQVNIYAEENIDHTFKRNKTNYW